MAYKDVIANITKEVKDLEATIELNDVEHKRATRDIQRQIDALRQKKKSILVEEGQKAVQACVLVPGDFVELKGSNFKGVIADLGARATEYDTIQVLAKVVRWVGDSDEDGDCSSLHETLIAADCLKKIT